MLLSIIIPCYNVSNRIEELYEMYSSSTNIEYEVIFVDDCSLDNSYAQMCSKFNKNAKFQVFQTSANVGPGIARNIGLKKANGDYVIFCDSDDSFDINIINTLNEFISQEHDIDLLVSPFKSRRGGKVFSCDRFSDYENHEKIISFDVARDDGHPWAKVFRKSLIEKYEILFPQRMTGEDKCFLIHYLSHANNILKFDYMFYTYVANKNSITHTKSTKELNLPTTFEILQPIYHKIYPNIEIEMFVKDHLLARAKQMSAAKYKNKVIKNWFQNENNRYPDWINQIEYKNQNLYRKLIYKAMFKSNAFLIKVYMFFRRLVY